MKRTLHMVFLMLFLTASFTYADDVKKISDNVAEITKTNVVQMSLDSLLNQEAILIKQKENLENQITKMDNIIEKAKQAGIKTKAEIDG